MKIKVEMTLAAILFLGRPASAQVEMLSAGPASARPESRSAPSYGTSAMINYTINAWEFTTYTSSATFTADGVTSRWLTTGGPWVAPVVLPSGANALEIELQGCDDTASGDVQLTFWKNFIAAGTPSVAMIGLLSTGDSAIPGCGYFATTVSTPETIDNQSNSYFVQLIQSGPNDGTLRFQAVRIRYKLQVSPDPAIATFTDVPIGHPQHRFVEALVAAGITAGCGSGNYCPTSPVTRGQMAVFLSVALGLHFPN